jgi:hypothetical protein
MQHKKPKVEYKIVPSSAGYDPDSWEKYDAAGYGKAGRCICGRVNGHSTIYDGFLCKRCEELSKNLPKDVWYIKLLKWVMK